MGGGGGAPRKFSKRQLGLCHAPAAAPPPLHARTQVEVRRSERVRGQEPTCYAEDAS